MPNNRLTSMNQYGDILYCGKYKYGDYRGIGDYPENVTIDGIEEIMKKLYFFEEAFEALLEKMEVFNGKRDSD